LDPAEERERERLTAAERDGAGGREERPEERKRFQGTDFLFSKNKKKKETGKSSPSPAYTYCMQVQI
jgi:hypothetical protein